MIIYKNNKTCKFAYYKLTKLLIVELLYMKDIQTKWLCILLDYKQTPTRIYGRSWKRLRIK